MTADLYSVFASGMRYVFVILGILIILQSFHWLYHDRRAKHARIQNLPDAGMIGEFIVLSGTQEIPENTALPVPWEGTMGTDRHSDIYLTGDGVAKNHLAFSFTPKRGLLVEPLGKSTCFADGESLSRPRGAWLTHGSVLEIGSYTLRLRLFAGLYVPSWDKARQEDIKNFGIERQSQGLPRKGAGGWDQPQTEKESYKGLHLVDDKGKRGKTE